MPASRIPLSAGATLSAALVRLLASCGIPEITFIPAAVMTPENYEELTAGN